ncbi:hypothetical protein GCM10011393_08470 [Sphingopyxis bauzanensis]|nr:hypothetical protein GCM10011393_08470 [Sphingopyxis bauzanensis]
MYPGMAMTLVGICEPWRTEGHPKLPPSLNMMGVAAFVLQRPGVPYAKVRGHVDDVAAAEKWSARDRYGVDRLDVIARPAGWKCHNRFALKVFCWQ